MIVESHKLLFVHIIKTAGVSIEKAFGAPTHDHRSIQEYRALLAERFDEYFSFVVVRNPWDKMVSQYEFNAHKWTSPGTTFAEYIRYFGSGGQVSRFSPFHLPYMTDENDEIIVDYVGRFEALEETMRHVCEVIGRSYRPLPHENRSIRKDYRFYYDDESAQIVERMFKEEIELFGYRFDR